MPELKCGICEQTFRYRKMLYNHMRYMHANEHKKLLQKQKRKKQEVVCLYCEEVLKSYALYRDHLIDAHQVELYKQSLEFASTDEFLTWKREKEKELHCLYIKVSGTKFYSKHKKAYYLCNKSYLSDKFKYVSKLKTSRKESRKMSYSCPSTIEFVEKEDVCQATIYLTHLGHDCTEEESEEVPSKHSKKNRERIDYEKILTDIRNKIHSLNISVSDEKQEHRDICKHFWVPHYYHEDEHTSLDILVSRLQTIRPESPILYYKPVGTKYEDELFNETDFFLAVMTDFQKFIAEKFASKVICIDCNHTSSSYNCLLTTIITVDEFGEAVPIAYLLSNRVDSLMLSCFFELLKNRLGFCLGTEILMTEDKLEVYSSWIQQMVEPKRHLLSLWDVDQNWRKQLSGKMRGKLALKTTIYEKLRCLAEIEQEDEFKLSLSQLIDDLYAVKQSQQFANFFSQHSEPRTQQWAYCYRKNLGINANVSLEATHKILRVIYLEGRKFKRMDQTLQVLIGMVRQYIFKRIKNMDGTNDQRIRLICSSHKKSGGVDPGKIQEFEFSSWIIKTSDSDECLVRKEASCTEENCQLMCVPCDTCEHVYSCTCLDNLLKGNMCKHIHAVCRLNQLNFKLKQERTASHEIMQEIESPVENDPIEITLNDKIDMIREYVEGTNNDDEILVQIDTMLDSCLELIDSTNKSDENGSDITIKEEIDVVDNKIVTVTTKKRRYQSTDVIFEKVPKVEYFQPDKKKKMRVKVISPDKFLQVMNQMKPHVSSNDHNYF